MKAKQATRAWADANLAAAHLILASEAKYGGPESLMAQWARLVIERQQPAIRGPLFGKAA